MLPQLAESLELKTIPPDAKTGPSRIAKEYLYLVNRRLANHRDITKGDPDRLQRRSQNMEGLVRNLDQLAKVGRLSDLDTDHRVDRARVEKLKFQAQRHRAFYEKLLKYKRTKDIKEQTLENVFESGPSAGSQDIFFKGDQLYATVTAGYGAEKLDPLHRQGIAGAYREWLKQTQGSEAKVGVESFIEFCLLSADDPSGTRGYFAKISRVPDLDLFAEHFALTFKGGQAHTEYCPTLASGYTKLVKLTELNLWKRYLAQTRPFHTYPLQFEENQTRYRVETELGPSDRLPYSFLYATRKQRIYAFPVAGGSDATARHPSAVGHKAVQAAGHIVAESGKIVAIDNNTGHYNVQWAFLRQAVELLAANGAFHPHAVVGVYAPSLKTDMKTLFLPVKEFRDMAFNYKLHEPGWIKGILREVKARIHGESDYYKKFLRSQEVDATDTIANGFASDMKGQSKSVVEGLGKTRIFSKAS